MQSDIHDTSHVSTNPTNHSASPNLKKNGRVSGLLFLTMKTVTHSPMYSRKLGVDHTRDCFDDPSLDCSLSDSMLRSQSTFSWCEQLEPYASLVRLCLFEDCVKVFVQGHRPFYAADCSTPLSTPCVLRRKTTKVRYIKEDANCQIPPVLVTTDSDLRSTFSTRILTEVEHEDTLDSSPGCISQTICRLLSLKDSVYVGTCRPLLLGSRVNKELSEVTGSPLQVPSGRKSGGVRMSHEGAMGKATPLLSSPHCSESPMVQMNLSLATVQQVSPNSFILCHEAIANKRRNLQFFCHPKLVPKWVSRISENIINSNYRLASVFNRASNSNSLIYVTTVSLDKTPRLVAITQTHLKIFNTDISNVLSDQPLLAFLLEDLIWDFPPADEDWGERRRASFGSSDSDSFQSYSNFEVHFTGKNIGCNRKLLVTLGFSCEDELSHWRVAIETVTKLARKHRHKSQTWSLRNQNGYKMPPHIS